MKLTSDNGASRLLIALFFLFLVGSVAAFGMSSSSDKLKVFVAGGTGAIGRFLVPKLVQAGHAVTVSTRSKAKCDFIRDMGANPVVCDILDRDDLVKKMAEAQPNVVVHQATGLSSVDDPFGETNRLRTQGTKNLIHAARQANVNKIVAQSVAFLCDPKADDKALTNEKTPLYLNKAPEALEPVVKALADLEKQVLEVEDMTGVVLRYGHFYGDHTFYALHGWVTSLIKQGKYPIVRDGKGVSSFIHVVDAADATIRAITKEDARGIYAIVDDTPAPVTTWVSGIAELLQAPAPQEHDEDQNQIDPFTTYFMTEQKGASNQKAKNDLKWKPQTPDFSVGLKALLSIQQTTAGAIE